MNARHVVIPSCFTYWPRSVFARPFLQVRFCKPLIHTILVFVYKPQTAARHTQWRRYIHRHSFGIEQLDADDETYAPYLHVRFCSVPCITHSRQSYLAFSPNVSCNPFLLHCASLTTLQTLYPLCKHSLRTIPSCFLLQHVVQSLLASLTDLGPFLHVRFCTSVFVNH
jgi:hypothetical protein